MKRFHEDSLRKRAFYFSDWHAQELPIFLLLLLLHGRTRGARISGSCSVAGESGRDTLGASLAQLGLTIYSSAFKSKSIWLPHIIHARTLIHLSSDQTDEKISPYA